MIRIINPNNQTKKARRSTEQGVNGGAFMSNKTFKMFKMFRTVLKVSRNAAMENKPTTKCDCKFG